MLEKMLKSLRHQMDRLVSPLTAPLGSIHDMLLRQFHQDLLVNHPNPLHRCGRKAFSQSDEDGITLEIIRRLALSRGCYAELGVGNGLENNTLVLAAIGWRGFWVGAQ